MARIFFFNDDVSYRILHKRKLDLWLQNVMLKEGYRLEDLNIVLCSDNQLLKVNKEHLNHDYYTDIITFDYSIEKQIIGELYISLDRVKNNAKDLNISLQKELHRVFVHGVLHMCGYKDKSKEEQKTMRSKEDFYLSLLKI